MPKIKLYFENYLVDNTDNISIPLTKTFDNIQDPMKYYSEYSRSVDIPFSVNNNKLFNHIFNVDSVQNSNPNQPNIGHNFDPKRKIPFRIEYNGDIILDGYAKLNSITYSNGGKYNITLFGKFGEIMQELHKLTFINPESNKYYIVSPKYDRISANLVKSAMEKKPSSTFSENSLSITDIITFVSNEGVYENFDTKKNVRYKITDKGVVSYMDIVDTSSFLKETYTYISNSNINPESIVGDAMLPGTWGEYRSYYQIPCMWVKRLWEMFIAAAKKATSYSFSLDPDFFNDNNPFYFEQVLALKPFNTKKESTYTSTFEINGSKELSWVNDTSTNIMPSNIIRTSTVSDEYGAGYDDTPDGQTSKVLFLKSKPNSYDTFTINFSQKYMIEFPTGGIEGKQYLNNFLVIDVILKTKDGSIINKCNYLVGRCKYEGLEEYDTPSILFYNMQNIILQDTYQENNPFTETTSLFFTLNYSYRTSQVINGCYLQIEMHWTGPSFGLTYDPKLSTSDTGVPHINDKLHVLKAGETVYVKPINELYPGEKNRLSVVISQKEKRSGDYFSFSDLWDKKVNPLEYLLEFSKIYGLVWNINEKNKTIVVRQQQNDYKEGLAQGIRDYTDKVDNREKVLKPAQFDCKYVRFNYADNKTAQGTEYKNAYGANYGELILNNGNEFNSSEKKLFSGLIPAPITQKKQIFKIKTPDNIDSTIYPETQAYTSIITTDKSSKTVDLFGSLFFVGPIITNIILTDDCNSEYFNNTYCYNRYGRDVISTKVRAKVASTVSSIYYYCNITNLFNIPNITYGEDFKDVKSIYELFWKDYFDERYSYKNKVIEVKMKLSIEDYNTIKRGTFIKIDNQLYVFNKISDFDIQGDGLTKCELLTVNNLDAYTTNWFLTYMHYLN